MKLTARFVLITGGSSGIGLEFAKQLCHRGNTVLITGRDRDRLERARLSVPGVVTFQSDASKPADIETLHDQVTARFPCLDVLINNAGIMRNLKLNQACDKRDVIREIDINLNGPIQMVQQFLPELKKQKESLIVNVSSGLALVPFTFSPVYSAAKSGLHAYTQCLRVQLKDTSVRVVELLPPGTETPLFRGEFEQEMKGQKAMAASDVVKQAISRIEAGKDEIRPGLTKVLGVMSRLAPRFMMAEMTRLATPRV